MTAAGSSSTSPTAVPAAAIITAGGTSVAAMLTGVAASSGHPVAILGALAADVAMTAYAVRALIVRRQPEPGDSATVRVGDETLPGEVIAASERAATIRYQLPTGGTAVDTFTPDRVQLDEPAAVDEPDTDGGAPA